MAVDWAEVRIPKVVGQKKGEGRLGWRGRLRVCLRGLLQHLPRPDGTIVSVQPAKHGYCRLLERRKGDQKISRVEDIPLDSHRQSNPSESQ